MTSGGTYGWKSNILGHILKALNGRLRNWAGVSLVEQEEQRFGSLQGGVGAW